MRLCRCACVFAIQEYKEELDPAKFKSVKTGRGPLGPDWQVRHCLTLRRCVFASHSNNSNPLPLIGSAEGARKGQRLPSHVRLQARHGWGQAASLYRKAGKPHSKCEELLRLLSGGQHFVDTCRPLVAIIWNSSLCAPALGPSRWNSASSPTLTGSCSAGSTSGPTCQWRTSAAWRRRRRRSWMMWELSLALGLLRPQLFQATCAAGAWPKPWLV